MNTSPMVSELTDQTLTMYYTYILVGIVAFALYVKLNTMFQLEKNQEYTDNLMCEYEEKLENLREMYSILDEKVNRLLSIDQTNLDKMNNT